VHFSLLVVGPDVEKQLEPFEACPEHENGYFDFYDIGGRWPKMLKLLPGREDVCGSEAGPERPGWADQVRKGDIDWEGMRAAPEAAARAVWRKAREITGGQLWLTCETIFAPIKDLEHTDRERWIQGMRQAGETYGNQPAVQKLHEAGYLDQTDLMALPEEEYVQLCPGLVTFAYLLNGVWHEKPWTNLRTEDRPWHNDSPPCWTAFPTTRCSPSLIITVDRGARNMSDDPVFQPTMTSMERLRDIAAPHFRDLLEEVYATYPDTPGAASALATGAAFGCWIEQQPNAESRRNCVWALDKMLQPVGVRVLLQQETH
jgi:hypothetical protein